MGAIFKLEHANIMAYVTSRSYAPPRVLRQHLSEFLDVLAYDAKRYLIPERGFEPWPAEMAAIAREAASRLRESQSAEERPVVPPPLLGQLLEGLRNEFSAYPLYALAVGSGEGVREKARELARAPMHGQLLVLIPENELTERNFEVLDPVPAFSTALHAAPDWPGFVFWTQTGASAFAKGYEADELVRRLGDAQYESRPRGPFPFPTSSGFDYVLREWSKRKPRKYRRLLHLSDLHFGTEEAIENQAILDAELSEVVQSVDRVVITGDLFDTPNKNYATLFTNFKNNITRLAGGREPIAITGNHDQRMIGLFGEDYKQVALIGSQKIIVDDQCEMIFVCFNSSEKGSFARGRITKSQFRQLGGEYRTLTSSRPELKSYLPVVLVHHHPFSFEIPPETLVQKALKAIGLGDEKLLVLANSEELHHWCMDWNIKTILHGHKHKARYVEREIVRASDRSALTAIGCGSSLGAEGSPVSYNMLEWEPSSQRWIASFFESINGGAFRETVAAVSPPR
jgi:calcineurin-like phosphoesterase family protein